MIRCSRNPRRSGLVVALVGPALVAFAAAAWACIPVATLTATPALVKPGETVTVTGSFYGKKSPVLLRFGALDGPVVATVTPDKSSGIISAAFAVPADTKPGSYVIVATQEAVRGETTWGVPSRALVTVAGDGGAPVLGPQLGSVETGRPAGLVTGESVGTGELVLVGLGVAGVAMFLAGTAAMLSGRRRAVPVSVTSER